MNFSLYPSTIRATSYAHAVLLGGGNSRREKAKGSEAGNFRISGGSLPILQIARLRTLGSASIVGRAKKA